MRYLFLITLFFLVIGQGFSQDEKKKFRFSEELSIYIIQNNNLGTNFLAEANKAIIGFGAELVVFKVYDFGLGFGLEKGYHKVIDNAIGGNISNTNTTLYHLNFHYYKNLGNSFRINPFLGFGELSLRQKTGNKHFGTQKGTNFGIGSNLSYLFSKELSIFLGIKYNFANLRVNTNEEFIDYFNHIEQVQLKFGLMLH